MGLIGIYDDVEKGCPTYTVESLHFNFWILPKSKFDNIRRFFSEPKFEFFKYYIDIGVRVNVTSGTLSTIDMHLPCSSPGDMDYLDLHEEILNEKINDLIFGIKVNSNNNKISYTRKYIKIEDEIHTINKISDVDKKDQRFRISLNSNVEISNKPKSIYLRFRYLCSVPSDILISKGWGFAKKGFVADLRLEDVRETIDFDQINQSHNMKDITEFNAFLFIRQTLLDSLRAPILGMHEC